MPTSAKIRQKKQSLDERIAALQREKREEQAKLAQAVRKEEAKEERRAGRLLRELGFALRDLEALRGRLERMLEREQQEPPLASWEGNGISIGSLSQSVQTGSVLGKVTP